MSRRRLMQCAIAGVVAVVAGAAWVATTALTVRARLLDVLDAGSELRTELLAGHVASARVRLAEIQAETRSARRVTDSAPWRVASHVPVAGRSIRVVRDVAAADAALADRVLPDLIGAGDALSPAALRVRGDTIDISRLHESSAPLVRAATTLATIRESVRATPRSWLVPPVRRARSDLLRQAGDLAGTIRTARTFAAVAPAMLGGSGVRRYFVAVQNNAEARGTGGLVGAYLILTAEQGRLQITATGNDTQLANAPAPVVDLGNDFTALYRRYASDSFWANSNLTPDFPSAARIWLALWRHMTGQSLDGALAVDPVGLAQVLSAAGPVRAPDGAVVTADDVVALTESTVYVRFADDDSRRKAYLESVARAVADHLLAGAGDTLAVAHQLGSAATSHHLLLWSAHPAEQAVIAGTAMSGALPTGASPTVGLVVNNLAGSKLDYWLRRSLVRQTGRCLPDGRRATSVVVRLSNQAPVGLPDYVVARFDRPRSLPRRGTNRLLVAVLLTPGAAVESATLDGRPTTVSLGREGVTRVVATTLEVPPDATRTLALSLREPGGGAVRVLEQPLAAPAVVSVDSAPPCS